MKTCLRYLACSLLMFGILTAEAQGDRPKPRVQALSVIGWWQSLDDPNFRMKFDDTLSYWYYADRLPTKERYWLVASCQSTKVVAYSKADYIVFKDPEAKGTDCAEFIANDNSHLGWMDTSTGHRQSFRRIKGPKSPTAAAH